MLPLFGKPDGNLRVGFTTRGLSRCYHIVVHPIMSLWPGFVNTRVGLKLLMPVVHPRNSWCRRCVNTVHYEMLIILSFCEFVSLKVYHLGSFLVPPDSFPKRELPSHPQRITGGCHLGAIQTHCRQEWLAMFVVLWDGRAEQLSSVLARVQHAGIQVSRSGEMQTNLCPSKRFSDNQPLSGMLSTTCNQRCRPHSGMLTLDSIPQRHLCKH